MTALFVTRLFVVSVDFVCFCEYQFHLPLVVINSANSPEGIKMRDHMLNTLHRVKKSIADSSLSELSIADPQMETIFSLFYCEWARGMIADRISNN